jgi:hypothetical protein
MKTVFQFRPGCHLSGDAQIVGNRLESIRTKCNVLTPDVVLDDARKSKSPLHQFFEWDDSIAAEQYRLRQAGHLIRSISVTFEDMADEPERQVTLAGISEPAPEIRAVRAFLAVQIEDGTNGYVGTREAMSDPEMRRQVLERAHRELSSVGQKWRDVSELTEVFMALDRVGELVSTERQPA